MKMEGINRRGVKLLVLQQSVTIKIESLLFIYTSKSKKWIN